MGEQDSVAVIGAGVVGCAIAWSLTREGWPVMLADPAEPGAGGASFGNAGHLGAELVEPLPSPALLFGFWRQLFVFGGALDLPWRRLPQFAPWAWRFAAAAFRQRANTRQFAPLVRPAAAAWERTLREVGSRALLRRNGHHQVWLTPAGARKAAAEARRMERLGVPTAPVPPELLHAVARAAGTGTIAGLEFPDTGHVLDPRGVCEALARAAVARGASVRRLRVLELAPCGDRIELRTDAGTLTVSAAIVCAGVWSAPLLAHFGLRAPLEAARDELHGVLRPRGRPRPAQARTPRGHPEAARVSLRQRQLRMGWPASGPSGLPARHRSGAGRSASVLRDRPSSSRADARAGHRRAHRGARGRSRARARRARLRPQALRLRRRAAGRSGGAEVLGNRFEQRRARPREGGAQLLRESRRSVHTNAGRAARGSERREVWITRHDADRRNAGGAHVVADLPEGAVVPDYDRKSQVELHGGHELL